MTVDIGDYDSKPLKKSLKWPAAKKPPGRPHVQAVVEQQDVMVLKLADFAGAVDVAHFFFKVILINEINGF